MNKHLEAAQKATEQLIRDAQIQLDGAKVSSRWHRIGDLESYVQGLEQIQIVYNHAIHNIKREEEEK